METFLSVFKEKETKRFKLKVGVFLLLIVENQVLLLRRYQTGIDDGLYVVPMGGHDGEISLSSTLIREAKEECNIDIAFEDLKVCHVMHRLRFMPEGLSFEQIDVFFKADQYKGVLQNNEPDKCDHLSFFPLDSLPSNMINEIKQALECIQHGIFYSEFGFTNALSQAT